MEEQYEYLTTSPNIEDGVFIVGHKPQTVEYKTLFGKSKSKTVYEPIKMSEKEWLNKMGKDGWELVNVIRNSFSHDLRDYYFRKKKALELTENEKLSLADIGSKYIYSLADDSQRISVGGVMQVINEYNQLLKNK